MFSVEYVYVPLMGKAYVSMDYCHALDVCENGSEMTLVLTHKAKNREGEEVTFKSNIVIPRQKISVQVV